MTSVLNLHDPIQTHTLIKPVCLTESSLIRMLIRKINIVGTMKGHIESSDGSTGGNYWLVMSHYD